MSEETKSPESKVVDVSDEFQAGYHKAMVDVLETVAIVLIVFGLLEILRGYFE